MTNETPANLPEAARTSDESRPRESEWDGNPDAELLRCIQVWDQMQGSTISGTGQKAVEAVNLRHALMGIASTLGERLELECTGKHEGDGWWTHDGDTCPIHEWLVPSDCPDEEEVPDAKR